MQTLTLSQDLLPRIILHWLPDICLYSLSPWSATSNGLHAFWLSVGFTQWEVLAYQKAEENEIRTFPADSLPTTEHELAEAPPKPTVPCRRCCPYGSLVTTSSPCQYASSLVSYQAQGTVLSPISFFNTGHTLQAVPLLNSA